MKSKDLKLFIEGLERKGDFYTVLHSDKLMGGAPSKTLALCEEGPTEYVGEECTYPISEEINTTMALCEEDPDPSCSI